MTKAAQFVARIANDHAMAWNRRDPENIADLFAEDAELSVNCGAPHVGQAAIIEIAKALLAAIPVLVVHHHETRHAAGGAVFLGTREGGHVEPGNTVTLPGWHEWKLADELRAADAGGATMLWIYCGRPGATAPALSAWERASHPGNRKTRAVSCGQASPPRHT